MWRLNNWYRVQAAGLLQAGHGCQHSDSPRLATAAHVHCHHTVALYAAQQYPHGPKDAPALPSTSGCTSSWIVLCQINPVLKICVVTNHNMPGSAVLSTLQISMMKQMLLSMAQHEECLSMVHMPGGVSPLPAPSSAWHGVCCQCLFGTQMA